MKLLYVDQFSEIGGGQRCFLQLLPALLDTGWEVHSAVPGDGPLAEMLRATQIPSGHYHSGPKSRADILRFPSDVRGQARVIAALHRATRFDLVYVNGPRVLPGVALATRGRVPVLFHAHSRVEQAYARRLAGFSIKAAVSTAIACSEFVAAPLRRYIAAPQLHVIPNGSPDLGFRPRLFDHPWRIGIVGRIEPQKGQLEFLQAAGALRGAEFVICGSPVPTQLDYYQSVRALAAGLPVEFSGWRPDMSAVYDSLDLVVMASTHEGFPLVMLEAFSAGAPVVAFPAGGIVEAIQDNETGFLVPERTADALAARLRDLMNGSPQRLQRVAERARRRWEESFDLTLYRQRMTGMIRQAAFETALRQ